MPQNEMSEGEKLVGGALEGLNEFLANGRAWKAKCLGTTSSSLWISSMAKGGSWGFDNPVSGEEPHGPQ